jgi:hypothetical protein
VEALEDLAVGRSRMAVTRAMFQRTRMEYTTREQFGDLGLKTTGWMVFGFRPQNPGVVSAGIRGGTWRHREACIKAKLSHEGCVAVGSTKIELDHIAHWARWFTLKYLGAIWGCVIGSINKR